jgi:hypothetical protein
MDIKVKAPLLGGVMLGAAAVGVLMGESAISQINPIYFQGAAVHPRERGAAVADIAPVEGERFADQYGWAEGRAARLADCIDCEALAARDQFAAPLVHHAVADIREEPRQAVAEPLPETFVVEYADVDRYAHYPIEADEEPVVEEEYASAEK